MRDGFSLETRRYGDAATAGRIVILLHGSGWHGMQFHKLAKALAALENIAVLVPDLRGHGVKPGRRGDIGFVGQFEEDIADLIGDARKTSPQAEIILGGHSSGGGLAVRFAGGRYGALAERYALLAPYLGHAAPTTRPNSGGWARPAIRRIIGLSMLNALRITFLNHLPVIAFAMPQAVLDGPLGHTATTAYSHRLNVSYAPRHHARDLGALTQPVLVLVGTDDEAFIAEQYDPVMARYSRQADTRLIEGCGHLDIVNNDEAITVLSRWIAG
ncbi:MAG: lysophospholipase [Alphaproteobacteria bacterium]|nr:lysophospholipase [Alphaproteobacteria bacterium]